MGYTNKDYKAFKKAMGLKNKDIAEILNVEKHSVDVATMPKKKELPNWARFGMWVFDKIQSEKKD